MSKYTTELRFICEMKSGFPVDEMQNYTPEQIIEASREQIFNFSFPIYDETHRAELETKIIKHYYTREISAETVGLWQLWLNERMNLIMPKYNRLYEYEHEILGKELNNIDVTKVTDRDDDFTRTDNLAHSRTTLDKYSDTPQGTIAGVDNSTYLTDYRNISENGTNTGTQRNAGSQDITEHETGYRGSKTYMELLNDYREKILNIDELIINELSNLFLMLW